MNIFILSIFPAPYRIAVFKGLSKEHKLTVFFERNCYGERSPSWFGRSDKDFCFYLLDNDDGRNFYKKCTLELKKYDIVICYDPLTKIARRLERMCKHHRIKYIINVDGALQIDNSFPKKQIKSFYIRGAYKCFAGCHRAEEYLENYGAKKSDILRHKFTSLYSDEILKKPILDKDKNSIRKRLELPIDTTYIAVGQFIYRKGFDLLLEAWSATKIARNYCKLIIIGGGKQKSEYLKLIDSKRLKESVILMDFKPHEELIDYYKASDVFVMPTREDIWGLVINEAMAVGLPVISSNSCTAANELITSGVNGFIYNTNDTDYLSEKIDELAQNSNKRYEFSKMALYAISEYSYENVIMMHLTELKNIGQYHTEKKQSDKRADGKMEV